MTRLKHPIVSMIHINVNTCLFYITLWKTTTIIIIIIISLLLLFIENNIIVVNHYNIEVTFSGAGMHFIEHKHGISIKPVYIHSIKLNINVHAHINKKIYVCI